jgi:tRNA nucleotidyltransferase/poly(A) polymerase
VRFAARFELHIAPEVLESF